VIQTVQAGYSLNGRVLRAAMVIVGSWKSIYQPPFIT
jgi:molecular chaperone GrpE (heat shock protein)